MTRTPFPTHEQRASAGRLGMWLLLLTLAVLFAANLIGLIVIRLQADFWPTNLPPLPWQLWISTVILLISSAVLQWGVVAIRADRKSALQSAMVLTIALAVAFLINQAWCWNAWLPAVKARWSDSDAMRLALAGFYLLTGLHALHVLSGLIPMLIVTAKACRHAYSRQQHAGVEFVAMYWHFLGGVWIVLLITLLLTS